VHGAARGETVCNDGRGTVSRDLFLRMASEVFERDDVPRDLAITEDEHEASSERIRTSQKRLERASSCVRFDRDSAASQVTREQQRSSHRGVAERRNEGVDGWLGAHRLSGDE